MPDKTVITVETTVQAPVSKVWKCWTDATDIVHWNAASDDWHTPRATIDLKEGGTFSYRMEAKDGSFGFDLNGTFTKVIPEKTIEYALEDDRKVSVAFEEKRGETHVIESFEAEGVNPPEMQRKGWQAILDNFKKYTEAQD